MKKMQLIVTAMLIMLALLSLSQDSLINLWCNRILDLFGVNSPEIKDWIIYHPKLWHVVLYAFLGSILYLLTQNLKLSAVTGFSFSALLEFFQLFVPSRGASFIDLSYNLIGILCGLFLIRLFSFLREKSVT